MAKEINITASLSIAQNGTVFAQIFPLVLDMAGDNMFQNIQDVGTTCEAVLLGDLATIGYLLLKNLDVTNYVELSSDNANANKIMKILPGGVALIPPGTITLYATAHTAGIKLFVLAGEL